MLKKEISIKSENTIICELLTNIVDKSLSGKNPPDEITVIAKLRELKDLIPKIFKITNIEIVKAEYNKKILIVCFNSSDLLNDKKFVNDFFKLSS